MAHPAILQTSPPPAAGGPDHGGPDDLVDRYRLLAELSPDGLIVHQHGRLVYANPATVRFTAATGPEQLLGQLILDFVHPDDRAALLERIDRLDGPGAVSPPAEVRIIGLDGSVTVVEATSVRTTWQGEPAMQAIMRDLRDSQAAHAALVYQAALVAHVSDGIVGVDSRGTVTSWNPAAETIYGWSAHDTVGRPVGEFLGSLPPIGETGQVRHVCRDNRTVTAQVSVSELRDLHGESCGAVIVCFDVTARLLAEQKYTSVVESLSEGILVLASNGVVESANPAAERVFGKTKLVGRTLADLPTWDESGRSLTLAERPSAIAHEQGRTVQDQVIGIAGHHGETRWMSVGARPLTTSGPPPYPVVLSFNDITDRKSASAALLHQATHDPLTSLANRAVVLQAIEDGLADRSGSAYGLTVVFLDLDNFKVVNDSFGHRVGDDVLLAVGQRLRAAAGQEDVVGRMGGDEFVVVSRSTQDIPAAHALADRLRAALSEPIPLAGRLIVVGASAGVVMVDAPNTWSAQDLLRDADVAMYQAKDLARGRHAIFDAEIQAAAMRRRRLEEDLRAALHTDQLWVAHQPVIDMRSGRVVSTEALLRWVHPELGFISPAEFIPIAEESGQIHALGLRVLEEACAQTAAWRSTDPRLRDLTIAVNLSARQLADPDLVTDVEAVLARTGLPAKALWFEITESMLMADVESAARILHQLRDCGIHLSIDDFGTGYSSLAYLRRFPVEALKIDRSFIMSMHIDADDAIIVEMVKTMAHGLGMHVVAEGVELPEQLEMLRGLGCDLVQGYLTGRPGRAADVLPVLLAGAV